MAGALQHDRVAVPQHRGQLYRSRQHLGGGNWMLPFSAATAVGAVCAVILFVVPIRPIRVDTLVPVGVVAREAAH